MKTNREWLNELAANDVDALQAWFDAEHFECPSDAGEAAIMSVNAFIAEHDTHSTKPNLSQLYGILSDDDCEQVDGSDVDSGADSREQLEADIDAWLDMWTAWSIPKRTLKLAAIEWIDRQAEITERECADDYRFKEIEISHLDIEQGEITRRYLPAERIDELTAQVDALKSESSEFAEGQDYWHDKCDELQRKLDNLAHDLAESERFREELREELSVAYDHAHDLLARRDRGLA